MSNEKVKVAISHGDVNGISYEVILKALSSPQLLDICTPVIYGSSKIAAYHRKALNLSSVTLNNISSGAEAHPRRVNMINCIDDNIRVELGKPSEASGRAAYQALEKAVEEVIKGEADILVTAPINKKSIQSSSFNFPGHTEYLASLVGGTPLMLMVNDWLRVGVVTGHIPVQEISKSISKDLIVEKLEILNHTLKTDFIIRRPRIAVLGLNPHAGDDGLLGKEEKEVIEPALKVARKQNIMAFGPFAADGFFATDNVKKFDAVLAMYHDQGLIPFKTLAFSSGVNFTAGLPIVRTSPDHGTAYELVGKNMADEQSFLSSIYMAVDIFKNRAVDKEINANPLKSSSDYSGEDE